ncbi:MAG: 7-carboxy-7-deazaguanine synthase QueE [Kofleriaceae bacterium]
MAQPHRYLVKEIFGPTVQGEGAHAGRACVFLRLAACNLACAWCDTDFAADGATRMTADEIAAALRELDVHGAALVIVTGGEPSLQWDAPLADALRGAGLRVHMESNGTHPLAAPVDWLTVSPKPQFHDGRFRLRPELPVAECKVVVDDTVDEEVLDAYESTWPEAQRFVQPCMDDRYPQHLARAVELVTRRPRWRLSLQLHKVIGVP